MSNHESEAGWVLPLHQSDMRHQTLLGLLLSGLLIKAILTEADGFDAKIKLSKRLLSDPYDPRNLYNFIYAKYYNNRRNSKYYSFLPKYEPVRRVSYENSPARQSWNIPHEYRAATAPPTPRTTTTARPIVSLLRTKPRSKLQEPDDPRNLFRAIYGYK